MRLISFDVGIKNMAFCIFNVDENEGSRTTIHNWNVLNLMEEECPKSVCNCTNKPKNKKVAAKPCTKLAKYCKFDKYYCDKHAKCDENYVIPMKQCSQTSLKKMKVADAITVCIQYNILTMEDKNMMKKNVLEKADIFFKSKCFENIVLGKKKSANDTDLITIGKNMKILLNEIDGINDITHVAIENQISPIANRMKTIQGMLAQYFIMKNSDIEIEFISSANKLSMSHVVLENTIKMTDSNIDTVDKKGKYKENKKNGVEQCSQLLDKNADFQLWKHVLETKKKDDLADCFLQGIWYMRKRCTPSSNNPMTNSLEI